MKYFPALILILSGTAVAQICAPTAVVRPNSQTAATLGASNCTLADGTWFADYLIDFPSRGTWTASVTPADGATAFSVVLRDLSGTRIDSGASLNRTVERGSYHVLVNAPSSNQGGDYSFKSSFSGVPNILCRHFAAMGTTRPISSSLGSGSCALPDGSAYDGYQLTLYGTGTVDIAVTSTDFAPLLILRTSDGQALGSNSVANDSGVVHLSVPAIGSDTYTVVMAVSSPDQSGGAYSMTATFTPDMDETCVSQAILTASQQYNGSIDTGSCNFNLPGREDSALFNYYNIHLENGGVMQTSVDTSDFSALLLLLDADGNAITDDIESGGSGTPLIRQQLPPGDYRLVLFNEDSFGGSYSLNYQFTPGPAAACTVTGIDSGSQMTGILSGTASCKDSIFMSDVYKVVLPEDGTVNLSLSSPDFSTFLDVHDSKDNDLTWGAQSSDGSASFVTVDLPAGTYYIDAASMDMPGGYALNYTFTPKTLPSCPAAFQMPPNGYYHNAQLSSASCEGTDGRKADFYSFTLSTASTEAMFMTSNFILPDLTLYQQDGTLLRSDQNSYADDNALIVQYLPAGTYTMRARSADPTEDGYYNIDLLFTPGQPQLCAPRSLATTARIAGVTSFTSCAWYDKTFADVYQLQVSGASQVLTIRVQSNDPYFADPFLILMDSKGSVVASDDNSGGGLNPLIIQTLDPGSYYVVIKPASDPSSAGKYILTTSTAAVPMVETRPRR